MPHWILIIFDSRQKHKDSLIGLRCSINQQPSCNVKHMSTRHMALMLVFPSSRLSSSEILDSSFRGAMMSSRREEPKEKDKVVTH
jgi:hypothetical protein